MLPSVLSSTSASRSNLFRGSMAGLCAPLSTLRRHLHRCRRMTRGPVWFATPSLQETFTLYSLPVSPAHQNSRDLLTGIHLSKTRNSADMTLKHDFCAAASANAMRCDQVRRAD